MKPPSRRLNEAHMMACSLNLCEREPSVRAMLELLVLAWHRSLEIGPDVGAGGDPTESSGDETPPPRSLLAGILPSPRWTG